MGGGNQVKPSEARIAARRVLKTRFAKPGEYSLKEVKRKPTDISDKVIYVAELTPEGFILLSGDKRHPMVLAFSEDGSMNIEDFKDMAPAARAWLEEQIGWFNILESDTSYQAKHDYQGQWYTYLSDEFPDTKVGQRLPDPQNCDLYYDHHETSIYDQVVLSTKWGQDLPYNLLVPDSCNNHPAFTGCVATAMAQIMKHWEFPIHYIVADPLVTRTYRWDLMRDSYDDNDTSISAYEVANLMRNIGNAVNMDYNSDCPLAGASINDAKRGFRNMGYNDVRIEDFSLSKIENEINNLRPVYVRGRRNVSGSNNDTDNGTVGHAWVCDGFRVDYDVYKRVCPYWGGDNVSYVSRNEQRYYHFNWGWEGHHNGWFVNGIYNQFPDSNGDNFVNPYKLYKKLIVNIKP